MQSTATEITNDKTLMPKEIRNANLATPIRPSSFVIRSSLVLSHSAFANLRVQKPYKKDATQRAVHFAVLNVFCSISSVLRSSNLYLRRKSSVMLMPRPGAVMG